MIAKAIQSDPLKVLAWENVIRKVVVGRVQGAGSKWTLSVHIGVPTTRMVSVRSRREPLRIWTSLTVLGRVAGSVDITGFTVEL